MEFITQFGSVTLLIPLAILLAGALWHYEGRRAAMTFMVPMTGCMSAMLLLKLYFISCGTGQAYGITSPSGHTASSTFVLGSVAVVVATHVRRYKAWMVLGLSTALILAIAISRVLLGAHTVEEVVAGFAVGVVTLLLFVVPYMRTVRRPIRLKVMAGAFLAVAALAYGVPSSAEQYIKMMSQHLRTETGECGNEQMRSSPSSVYG
ncbi:MAG: phosphatase PAP2 family protein [Janthinobacterium lividum]